MPGIPADDVFCDTMSPDLIARSDQRREDLRREFLTLRALRKAMAVTQADLGGRLDRSQVAVAKVEGRSDMMVSTLRDYVSALGGDLELVVRLPGDRTIVLENIGVEAAVPEQARRGQRRRKKAERRPGPEAA